jgi:hypothetical protein
MFQCVMSDEGTEEGTENTVRVGERSVYEVTLAEVQDADDFVLQEQVGKQVGMIAQSLYEQGRVLISDAKKRSAVILRDAENEADIILAGAVEETKKWEAEKEALAGVQHFEQRVKLNIGSMRFETSLTTLCRFPDTMIGCMFSGRHALPKGEDGYFFIDRDGTHFRHILNFLRSPESYKPGLKGAEEVELLGECKYYGIDQLMFPPTGTQKSLYYRDLKGQTQGAINVQVEHGVHTILDSGESIRLCPHCECGIFNIGAEQYYFYGFSTSTDYPFEKSVSLQPRVQGQCPHCHQ